MGDEECRASRSSSAANGSSARPSMKAASTSGHPDSAHPHNQGLPGERRSYRRLSGCSCEGGRLVRPRPGPRPGLGLGTVGLGLGGDAPHRWLGSLRKGLPLGSSRPVRREPAVVAGHPHPHPPPQHAHTRARRVAPPPARTPPIPTDPITSALSPHPPCHSPHALPTHRSQNSAVDLLTPWQTKA